MLKRQKDSVLNATRTDKDVLSAHMSASPLLVLLASACAALLCARASTSEQCQRVRPLSACCAVLCALCSVRSVVCMYVVCVCAAAQRQQGV
jgi:hypothetical protein